MRKPNIKIQLESVNKLRPVKKKRLYEDIVKQIQILIKEGKIKSGDQIPPERELVEIFRVSRNSVREAIRTLEEKQIVKSLPGDGTYVIIKNEILLIEHLAKAIHIEKSKLYEIFQFRGLIEPEIASFAAKNALSQDIKDLDEILEKQRTEIKFLERAIEFDKLFHIMIARESGNSIFLTIVQALNDILGESRSEFFQNEKRSIKSLAGHFEILKHVKQRNPRLARKAMKDHLKSIEQIVLHQQKQMKKGKI